MRGQGGQPAQGQDWIFTLWATVGSFLGLLLASGIDEFVSQPYRGGRLTVLIASVGALPRNVIGAHIIASVVALLVDYISNPFYAPVIPQWIAQTLSPALVIGITAKLGLTHPPAGAAALLYASQNSRSADLTPLGGELCAAQASVKPLGWLYLACPVLLSSAILVFAGLIINNMRRKVAYPVYW